MTRGGRDAPSHGRRLGVKRGPPPRLLSRRTTRRTNRETFFPRRNLVLKQRLHVPDGLPLGRRGTDPRRAVARHPPRATPATRALPCATSVGGEASCAKRLRLASRPPLRGRWPASQIVSWDRADSSTHPTSSRQRRRTYLLLLPRGAIGGPLRLETALRADYALTARERARIGVRVPIFSPSVIPIERPGGWCDWRELLSPGSDSESIFVRRARSQRPASLDAVHRLLLYIASTCCRARVGPHADPADRRPSIRRSVCTKTQIPRRHLVGPTSRTRGRPLRYRGEVRLLPHRERELAIASRSDPRNPYYCLGSERQLSSHLNRHRPYSGALRRGRETGSILRASLDDPPAARAEARLPPRRAGDVRHHQPARSRCRMSGRPHRQPGGTIRSTSSCCPATLLRAATTASCAEIAY